MQDEPSDLDRSFISFLGHQDENSGLYEDCTESLMAVPTKLKQVLAQLEVKIVLAPTMELAFAVTGDPVLAPSGYYTWCAYSSTARTLYLADGPNHPSGIGRTTYPDVKEGLLRAYGELSGESSNASFHQDFDDDCNQMSPRLAARYLIAPNARDPVPWFSLLGTDYLYRNENDFFKEHYVEIQEAFPKAIKRVQAALEQFET